jgi:hypothetical protein
LLLFAKDQTSFPILSQEIIVVLSYEVFVMLVHGPFLSVLGMCSMRVFLKVQSSAFSNLF